MVWHRHSDKKKKEIQGRIFFKRVAPFSPVGGYFHVSGHLLRQQLPVVVTLFPRLLPQVDLLAIHFIYSFLYTKTKTQWRDTLIHSEELNRCTDLWWRPSQTSSPLISSVCAAFLISTSSSSSQLHFSSSESSFCSSETCKHTHTHNIQQTLFSETPWPEKPLWLFSDKCKNAGNVLEIWISQRIIIMHFHYLSCKLCKWGDEKAVSE